MTRKTIKTFFAPAIFMDVFKYSTGKLREHSQRILSISLSANFTTPSLKTPIIISRFAATIASKKKNELNIILEQRQRINQSTFHFNGQGQVIEKLIAEIKQHPTLLGMTWKINQLVLENTDSGEVTKWRNQRVNGGRSLMCYSVNEVTIDKLSYKQIMNAVGGFYEDACKVQMSENKFTSWEHLPCKV